MKSGLYFLLILIPLSYSCKQVTNEPTTAKNKAIDSIKTYTQPSELQNKYIGFNSPKAINQIAEIENEYFNAYRLNASKYYGTQWYSSVGLSVELTDSISVFERYSQEKNNGKLDSMHCTLYAVKALEAWFRTLYALSVPTTEYSRLVAPAEGLITIPIIISASLPGLQVTSCVMETVGFVIST